MIVQSDQKLGTAILQSGNQIFLITPEFRKILFAELCTRTKQRCGKKF